MQKKKKKKIEKEQKKAASHESESMQTGRGLDIVLLLAAVAAR